MLICSHESGITFNTLQTGSGKTYTMGTGFRDGCQTGVIPEVMSALFDKIETSKHETEYQLHVSFIEVTLYNFCLHS